MKCVEKILIIEGITKSYAGIVYLNTIPELEKIKKDINFKLEVINDLILKYTSLKPQAREDDPHGNYIFVITNTGGVQETFSYTSR